MAVRITQLRLRMLARSIHTDNTVTGVNKVTGEVMGNLYCTSVTGSTDGVTKDSGGRLIGYQRISGSALIYRNYSGYAKLKKGKTQDGAYEWESTVFSGRRMLWNLQRSVGDQ